MIGILIAAFFSLSPVTPALHAPFAVVDNGGVLVTRQPLHTGQVIYSGGIAYTVTLASGSVIRVSPGLPGSDRGKTVTFST